MVIHSAVDLDDPKPMGISLADHLTGIFACYGILVALHGRMVTDGGQLVETSLLQSLDGDVTAPPTFALRNNLTPDLIRDL